MPKPIVATIMLPAAALLAAVLSAAPAFAVKVVDMGSIDPGTLTEACRSAGLPTRVGEGYYGCSGNGVSIRCNSKTCLAFGSDLAPLRGNSLRGVISVMQHRAGYMIEPLDHRVRPLR